MKSVMVFLLSMVLLPSLVQAETAFVTDNLFVSIRDGQGKEFSTIKSVVAGTELEVLQRQDGFVQVREPGGVEGWIARRYLVNAAPGIAKLRTTNNKLKLANGKVARLKKQLAVSNSATDTLTKKLENLGQSPTGETAPASNTAGSESAASGFNFSWLWLLVSFAMLVIGFAAGVFWLRELNRKKMGGMYLRI